MIRSSFSILPGICEETEQSLWLQGITTWDAFLRVESVQSISPRRKQEMNRQIIEAKQHLHCQDSAFFIDKLASTEMWRLYSFFRDECIFLDIESSGSSQDSYI